MFSNFRLPTACLSVALICVFASNGALAKKPVPPPPPDPINFHYEFVNIHDGELAEWSFPQGMNDGGFVVGNYGAFELGERPFVWPDPRSPATISMVDLNDLFDPLLHPNLVLTNAVDINDLDQVVGIARDTTTNVLGVYILTLPDAGDAFGTLNLLPDPGFRYMRVAALNDSGDVAGSHWPEGDLQSAFLYTVEDGFVNLGSLEGKPIRTYAMTNRDAADAIDVTGNTQPGQYANRAWRFTGYAGNLLDGNGDLVGGLVNLNTDYYKAKRDTWVTVGPRTSMMPGSSRAKQPSPPTTSAQRCMMGSPGNRWGISWVT